MAKLKYILNIYTLIMAITFSETPSSRKPRRKKYSKKGKGGKSSIKKLVKQSLKELNVDTPEVKIFDTISSPTNITTTSTTMTSGMIIPQGLTDLSRIGKSIKIVRYTFRMTIYPDPSATDPGEVRMIWIRQAFPNQAVQTPSGTLQTVTNIHSPFQFDTSGYQVLMDRTYSFPLATMENKYLVVSLPFVNGKRYEWTEGDTTGTVANTVKGYIRGFIMYNGFGGTAPSYDLYQRVYFVDA